jgi:PAS domain S-box-containing protein
MTQKSATDHDVGRQTEAAPEQPLQADNPANPAAAAMPEGPRFTRNRFRPFTLETEEVSWPPEVTEPASPESLEPEAESPMAAGDPHALASAQLLNRMMQGISSSLQDLQGIVKAACQQTKAGATREAGSPGTEAGSYRDRFESAPDAYLVTDDRGIIREGNRAAAAMLMTPQPSLPGKPVMEFIAVEDRSSFQATMIQLRQTGAKRHWEMRLKLPDDTQMPVFISVGGLKDPQDTLVQLLWLLREGRERKVEEGRLKTLLGQMKTCLTGVVQAFANAVEMKHPQIAGHQQRVAYLAVAIAREMDFSLNQIEGLKIIGLLHDIGMIGVPIEILGKPGALRPPEIDLIKTHCQVGCDLLENIDFPWPVLPTILQHHERLDGSGYPGNLTDKDIILEARILGVADVVEAMVCPRPYGPAQGIDKALEEIYQNMGILYDPEVVNICLKLFVEKGFKFN